MPGSTPAGPLRPARPDVVATLRDDLRRAGGAALDRPWALLVAWQVVLVAW
ncbi:hypothetical protein [Amnibacterium kyonggiense]|uniref:Uncharacterized protein n=1 Tax=Amnibacterium kyonggiense TaxID=595671 RepID=A0A4V3EB22_9MICO|nr:hypothetical protein [Amnibacterium kyonggiense]TDS77494.1 hypothetical protein CLV52_2440 [Amnibacterium kyonggiense]